MTGCTRGLHPAADRLYKLGALDLPSAVTFVAVNAKANGKRPCPQALDLHPVLIALRRFASLAQQRPAVVRAHQLVTARFAGELIRRGEACCNQVLLAADVLIKAAVLLALQPW